MFTEFPEAITRVDTLQRLYFGANRISELPDSVGRMANLEVLYLGGNQLHTLNASVGSLARLTVLNLGENRLTTLPDSVTNLINLQAFSLQGNLFRALPPFILKLQGLERLALRNNPLVSSFVEEYKPQVLSLRETCARFIRQKSITYSTSTLPDSLVAYLDSAKRCTNDSCPGVYFATRSNKIEFVDFCGKFRLPLQQFLCTRCPPTSDDNSATTASLPPQSRLAQVLLTGYTEA